MWSLILGTESYRNKKDMVSVLPAAQVVLERGKEMWYINSENGEVVQRSKQGKASREKGIWDEN